MSTNLLDQDEYILEDSNGDILFAIGATVPTDATSGYAVGCIFQHSDGTTDTALYVNEGSITSCDFNAVAMTGGASVKNVTKLESADSPYTVLSTDYYLQANVAQGDSSLEIRFSANPTTGQIFAVLNMNTMDIVISFFDQDGSIDGATTLVLNDQYDSATLISDGTNLHVVGQSYTA